MGREFIGDGMGWDIELELELMRVLVVRAMRVGSF